jgi:hypothetical protein
MSLAVVDIVPPGAPTRFDLLLGAMAAPLFLALVVGALSAVPTYLAAGVGSVLASVPLVEATFRNPPT